MSNFTFYDYIDADGGGTNVIKDWLNGEGADSKAYFAKMIPSLETSSQPGYKDSLWQERYTKPLKREWDGFREFRKTGSVQYRLIGQVQDKSVFLTACAIHKDQHYSTTVSSETASNRVEQMRNDPAKYRREHEYD